MKIYDKIKDLCKEKGITITGLEKELGFARGSLSKIDKNKPSIDRIRKLADYFSKPVEYFTSDDVRFIGHQNEYYNPETYEMAQAIFDRPDLHALMKAAMDCEPDQIQSVADMLLRFKEANIDG